MMVKDRSPLRGTVKTVVRLNPAQREKRRYNRHLNDVAAMKILAPMMNAQKPIVLTDLS